MSAVLKVVVVVFKVSWFLLIIAVVFVIVAAAVCAFSVTGLNAEWKELFRSVGGSEIDLNNISIY